MDSNRLHDLHPLDDNNTQEALDGFLKAVEKAKKIEEENEKTKEQNKEDE